MERFSRQRELYYDLIKYHIHIHPSSLLAWLHRYEVWRSLRKKYLRHSWAPLFVSFVKKSFSLNYYQNFLYRLHISTSYYILYLLHISISYDILYLLHISTESVTRGNWFHTSGCSLFVKEVKESSFLKKRKMHFQVWKRKGTGEGLHAGDDGDGSNMEEVRADLCEIGSCGKDSCGRIEVLSSLHQPIYKRGGMGEVTA